MGKETQTPAQTLQAAKAAAAAPGTGSGEHKESHWLTPKKLIMFGIPTFLLQAVLIYFLVVKFVTPSVNGPQAAEVKEKAHEEPKEPRPVFVVKDIIINPAGTQGSRFLLTTVGLEVEDKKGLEEVTAKEVQVRDLLNTVLTNKSLPELADMSLRDSIRSEIQGRISAVMVEGKITNVFFSKYIIQ